MIFQQVVQSTTSFIVGTFQNIVTLVSTPEGRILLAHLLGPIILDVVLEMGGYGLFVDMKDIILEFTQPVINYITVLISIVSLIANFIPLTKLATAMTGFMIYAKAGIDLMQEVLKNNFAVKFILKKLDAGYELVKISGEFCIKKGSDVRKCTSFLGCFSKNTPVLMANNNPFKAPALAYSLAALPLIYPIQNVEPDDLVKAYHHEQSYYATADNNDKVYVPGWQDYDYLNITPETWQIGTFEIIEANGDKVEVEANRPKTWFAENKVNNINDRTWFYMPEIGINGEANLLSIRPTVINTTNFALNESGMVDRPVITTFKRNAPIVYDYYFSDGAVIGATPEHPFFSVDRNNYIAVGELQLGEQVMTAGEKVVKFLAGKQRDKGEPVYNFEVWREHNYYVGSKESGEFLLVHNSCEGFWSKKLKYETGWELPIDHIWRGHSFTNKVPGKTYFGQSMTKEKIKDLVNEMLKDPSVQWEDIGGQLRALVDGTKYPGFPSTLGHDVDGTILNKIRVSIAQDGQDIVIKNAFPSKTIQ